MQHDDPDRGTGDLASANPMLFPVPPSVVEPSAEQARAWFAIHRERIVDAWLAIVMPHDAGGHDPAFARLRLDGYLRAIVTSILSPAPSPYIERTVGSGLAGLCHGSDAGLHDLRTRLIPVLTDGLPQPLRESIDERLQRTLTQVIRGYCQQALQPAPPAADEPSARPAAGDSVLRRFIDQYPGLLTITTVPDDRLVAGNEASQRLLGYSLHDFMTIDEQDLFGLETPEDDFDIGVDLLAGRMPLIQRTSLMRHRDGHMVPLAIRLWVLRDDDGEPTHLVSEFDTLPTPKDGASHWQQADKRFRHLAQLSHDALLVVRRDGLIHYASPSTERSLGVDPDTIRETRLAELAVDDDQGLIDTFLERLATSPPRSTAETVVRMRRLDGLWRWFEISGANLLDVPDFAGFSIQARDITDRRHLEELLGQQARLDPLTGLLNRRGLLDLIAGDIAHYEATGEKMALLFVDLDHFKEINDRYGHATGDLVLTEMTGRLSRAIGATSAAGRLGGDEFVVVMRDTSPAGAMSAGRELITTLSEPITHRHVAIPTGVCIGIALTERLGQTTASLLRAADAALYRAKMARDGNPAMGHDLPE
jgi:diguanylate cyclase (GGDEF)-like protein/PAS domain S-box-containing protein